METTPVMTRDEVSELRRDIQQFKSDLRHVRSDVVCIKEDALRAARVAAAETRDRIRAGAREAAVRGRDMAEHTVNAAHDRVAAHPLMSVVTAFGLGVALGATLSWSARQRVAHAIH